jgi:hypothetical protein
MFFFRPAVDGAYLHTYKTVKASNAVTNTCGCVFLGGR